MTRQWIATGLAIVGLGLQATAAIAQPVIAEPTIAQPNMTNGYLNIQMRLSLCVQDWAGAIRVVDQMKQVAPQYSLRDLNYYRARLVILRNKSARVPSWPSANYCSGKSPTDIADDSEDSPTEVQ